MKSGLLWYDASAKDIAEKIKKAAERYAQKFGVYPDTAFVNTKDAPKEKKVEGIEVRTSGIIMPNHIWLGVSE